MKTMSRTQASILALASLLLVACARGRDSEKDESGEFHTSGSREADQRAEQRVSKEEQLRGEGEGGEKPKLRAPLYERLGAEAGIRSIVDDFVERVIADPRANWERKGVKRGGVIGIGDKSAEWKPTPESIETLKLHLVQFIAVATGGPTTYEGQGMDKVHSGMKITN